MGYWWPPSVYAFDPVERPFLPHAGTIGDAFDAVGDSAGKAKASPSDLLRAFPVPSRDDVELLKFSFGWGTPAMVKVRGALYTYASMISKRAPEDPASGGLCADSIEPDGVLRINYYDLAGTDAHRKRIRLRPKKDGSGYEIDPLTGGVPELLQAGVWKNEGPDAEREFWKASPALMSGMIAVASMALSMVPGGQIPAAVLSAAWSLGMKSVGSGKPPSLEDVIGAFGEAGAKAVGVLSSNPDLQKFFTNGFIGQMGRELTKAKGVVDDLLKKGQQTTVWAQALGQVGSRYGASFPKIDLGKMFPAGFDMAKWAKGELRDLTAARPQAFGASSTPVNLSPDAPEPAPDYVQAAWDAAARAFLEPDPTVRLQLRRNFGLVWGSSSSMLTHGNQTGIAAHADIEYGPGVTEACAYFDQFLVTMLSSVPSVHVPRSIPAGGTGGQPPTLEGLIADFQHTIQKFPAHPHIARFREKLRALEAELAMTKARIEQKRGSPEEKALLELVGELKDRYQMP